MSIINTAPILDPEDADVFAGYEDYYGFEKKDRFYLPDGKQWIEFKSLNEGARAKYEAKTSKEVSFNRKTDDAKMKLDAANDRHELIIESVCNWNMARKDPSTGGWSFVPFSKGQNRSSFDTWLHQSDPTVVNNLYKAIQKANGWMAAEMTPETLREEIARLNEMLEESLKRESAEKNS